MQKECRGRLFEFPGSLEGSHSHPGRGDSASGRHTVSSPLLPTAVLTLECVWL